MTAPSALPPFAELHAPATWRTVDFIADLHLQASDPATARAWRDYLEVPSADALFILGDLFEVWIGDDAAEPGSFEADCGDALRAAAGRRPVFFMPGNRDFLLGEVFLTAAGVTLLADPTVLVLHGQRLLLSHGDALCLDDTDYQRFRAQVRDAAWQAQFLARPLEERRAFARSVRNESESRKQPDGGYADLDPAATRAWLLHANAPVMVHGHTHRPATHALGDGGPELGPLQRIVLSDWDAAARPPRLEALRYTAHSPWTRVALPPAG